MRWPWSRPEPEGTPEQALERTPAPLPERPTAAWAALPALQRTLAPATLTTSPVGFVAGLAAWRSGGLMTAIQRQVHPVVPRIGPDPEAWGVGRPTQARAAAPMPLRADRARLQPHVQRRATGSVGTFDRAPNAEARAARPAPGSSGLTSARDDGLPVVQLIAEPLPPEPEPMPEPAPMPEPGLPPTPEAEVLSAPGLDEPVPARVEESAAGEVGAQEQDAARDRPTELDAATVDTATPPVTPPPATEPAPMTEPRSVPLPRAPMPVVPSTRLPELTPVQRSVVTPHESPAPEPPTPPRQPAGDVATLQMSPDGTAPAPGTTGPVIGSPRSGRPRLGLGEPLSTIPEPTTLTGSAPSPRIPPLDLAVAGPFVRPTSAHVPAEQHLPIAQRAVTEPVSGSGSTAAPATVEPTASNEPTASSGATASGPAALPAGHDGETIVDIPHGPLLTPGAAAPALIDPEAPTPPPTEAGPAEIDPETPDAPTDPPHLALPVVQRTTSAPSAAPASPGGSVPAPEATPSPTVTPDHAESAVTEPTDPAPTAEEPWAPLPLPTAAARAPDAGDDDPEALPLSADQSPEPVWQATDSASSAAALAEPGSPPSPDLRVVPLQRLVDPSPVEAVEHTADATSSRAAVRPEADASPAARSVAASPRPPLPLQRLSTDGHRADGWASVVRPQVPGPAPAIGMPIGRPGHAAFGSMSGSDSVATAASMEDVADDARLQAAADTSAPSTPLSVQTVEHIDGPVATTVVQSSSTGAKAGPGQSPTEVDELARTLFEPLMLRLRAELLVERERRGLRTDAW